MSQRQWIISVLWFAGVLSVTGQTSPVTSCISTYNWSINALQETPCLVAAFLESACTSTGILVPTLPLGNHYLGPNATEVNPCLCSSVTYSMISACAGCQDRNFIDWLTWSQDCTQISFTTFPKAVDPSEVVIPLWAYLNLTLTNNTFNEAAAQQNNSASLSATSSSAIMASTSASTSTPTSTPTPTPSTTIKSKSNAGAIAGGVVGGLVFSAISALGGLWFYIRRKRNMVQKNVAFDSRALVSGTGMSQTTGSMQGPSGLSPPSQSIYTSDMSIYPGSPLTTSGVFTTGIPPSRRSLESVSLSLAQFGGGPQTHGLVPRGYTGTPEV